ncbi:hypothetical protein MMPV_008175 [Pyropia vietnamensis]
MDPTDSAAADPQANVLTGDTPEVRTVTAEEGEEKVPVAAPPLLLPPPASASAVVTSIDDDDDDDDDDEGREPSATFHFTMTAASPIEDDKIHSAWNPFGGYQWRFLIFPNGNQTSEDLSLYLDCGGPFSPPATRDTWWSRMASFKLVLLAEGAKDGSTAVAEVIKEATHNFSLREADWGFRDFVKLSAIRGRKQLRFEARVTLTNATPYTAAHSSWAPAWDSRKETGFVGFKNQGATCYLNSLLQTLYCLSAFRRAVYMMPLPPVSGNGDVEGKEGSSTVAERQSYELQKVFYELQSSPSTVKTKRLTESFGWDNAELFQQHDAQELNRVLCDRLAETLKRGKVKDTVAELFEGKTTSFVECTDVEYTSSRDEVFYDLSLNVLGLAGVDEALRAYTAVEIMDGDNRVRADGYEELQRAKKGVRFARLPPVLQLHLKRFDFDFARDPPVQVKINDYFHFGAELDLRSFVAKSPEQGAAEGVKGGDKAIARIDEEGDADHLATSDGDAPTPAAADEKSNGSTQPVDEVEEEITVQTSEEDAVYILHAVLVHIGDVDAGHYCAFIRPDPEQGQWYKFDDETVTKVSSRAAIDENYGVGGPHQPPMEEHALNKTTRSAKTKKKGVTSPQALTADNTSPTRNSGEVLSADVENSPTPPPPTRKPRFRTAFATRRFGSAYMLQYVRKSEAKNLLAPIADEDVPQGLAERIEAERVAESLARRERAEQHLYISASIMTAASMSTYGGSDLGPWHTLPRVKAKRGLPLRDFKELLVSQGHGRSADALRVWKCSRRQNETVRPDVLLAGGVDSSPIIAAEGGDGGLGDGNTPGLGLALGRHHPRAHDLDEENLRLYVEELTDEELAIAFAKQGELDIRAGVTIPPTAEVMSQAMAHPKGDAGLMLTQAPPLPEGEILLFVKQYLPLARERQLRIIGRVVAKQDGIVPDILPEVVALAGLPEGTPVNLYEEVSARLIEPLALSATFDDAELAGGDILVVESVADTVAYKSPEAFADLTPEERSLLPLRGERLEEAPMYFRYLSSGVRVEFRDKWATPDSPVASPTAAAGTSPLASSRTAGSVTPGKVTLELLRTDNIGVVKSHLARALNGADPDYLRLFVHDPYRDCPRPTAVMPIEARELSAMLPGGNWAFQTTTSDEDDARVLWYERTDYPVAEYAHKTEVRVTWRPDGGGGGIAAAAAALVVPDSPVESQSSADESGNQLASSLADASLSDGIAMSDVSNGVHEGTATVEPASVVEPSVAAVDLRDLSPAVIASTDSVGRVTSIPPPPPLPPVPVAEVIESGVKVAVPRQLSVLVKEDATLEAVAREVHRRLALPHGVSVRLMKAEGSVVPRELSPTVPVRGASDATLSGVAEMRAEPVRPDDCPNSAWGLVPLVHISPSSASAAGVRGRANGGQLGANGNQKAPALNVMSKPRRASSLFGTSLLFPVLLGGETVGALRERIRERLGVPPVEFATWNLTQMINWRPVPLDNDDEVWTPAPQLDGDEWSCLAIEHKSTTVHKRPTTTSGRMADKPLTIRS